MINPLKVDIWILAKIIFMSGLLFGTLMNNGFTLAGAIIVLCCVIGIPGNVAQLSEIDDTREIQ